MQYISMAKIAADSMWLKCLLPIFDENWDFYNSQHNRKIDMCDKVLVLHDGDKWISIAEEIRYARTKGKPVLFLNVLELKY